MPLQGHVPPCLSAGLQHQLCDVLHSIPLFLESVPAAGEGVLSDLTLKQPMDNLEKSQDFVFSWKCSCRKNESPG